MINVWDKFQDPLWQRDAIRRGTPKELSQWAIKHYSDYDNKPMDTPKERQHKIRIMEFFRTKNIMIDRPQANDVDKALIQELLLSEEYQFIPDNKIAHFNHIKNKVLKLNQSLTLQDLQQLFYIMQKGHRVLARKNKKDKTTYEQIKKQIYKYKCK